MKKGQGVGLSILFLTVLLHVRTLEGVLQPVEVAKVRKIRELLNKSDTAYNMLDTKKMMHDEIESSMNNLSGNEIEARAKQRLAVTSNATRSIKAEHIRGLHKLRWQYCLQKKTQKKIERMKKGVCQSLDMCDMVSRKVRCATQELDMLYGPQEDSKDVTEIIGQAIFLAKKQGEIKKEDYNPDIVLYKLMKAIWQRTRIIKIASPLLRDMFDFYNRFEAEKEDLAKSYSCYNGFLKRFVSMFKDLLAQEKLQFYTTRHEGRKQEFAVIVSVEDKETIDLKKLGLNPDLRRICQNDIFAQLAPKISPARYVANIKDLLYIPQTEREKNSLPRKITYLLGHGTPAPHLKNPKKNRLLGVGTYGGIKVADYPALLDILRQSNNKALAIMSCYSAGWNGLKMHSASAGFPIFLSSTPDSVSLGNLNLNLTGFFVYMREVINKNIPYAKWYTDETCKKALRSIYSSRLQNIASMLSPDDIYPRVIDIYSSLRRVAADDKRTIQIKKSQKAFLFEESVYKATLCGEVPALVSMIGGPAHFFLGGIYTSVTLEELLKKAIGGLKIASPRMFFLGDVVCQNSSEFDQISENGTLAMKNFYYKTQYKKEVRSGKKEAFVSVTGGGLIKSQNYFSRQRDTWFTFTYNTYDKNLKVTTVEKEVYAKNMIKDLRYTMPKKDAVYAANPTNEKLMITFLGVPYYNVDELFLETINNCLKHEGLEMQIVDQDEFFQIERACPSLVENVKERVQEKVECMLNSPVLVRVVPTAVRNYFLNEKLRVY